MKKRPIRAAHPRMSLYASTPPGQNTPITEWESMIIALGSHHMEGKMTTKNLMSKF